ncbi:MAG TPA: nitrate- and nitrite sensing domain-containing protein, partial [Micromonospora sp.]
MKTPRWSIRSKIFALVAVPVAGLLTLWIFATTLAVGPASSLLKGRVVLNDLANPSKELISALQRERQLSVVSLAGGERVEALAEQRAVTDQALVQFRRGVDGSGLRDGKGGELDKRLDAFLTTLDNIPAGRSFIDRRQVDRIGAFGFYTGIISTGFEAFEATTGSPDEELTRRAMAITTLAMGRESLHQIDTLLAGAFTGGKLGDDEPARIAQIIGVRRYVYTSATADLTDADRTAFQQLTESPDFVRLRDLEETLLTRARPGAAPPVDAQQWWATYDTVQRRLDDFEVAATASLSDDAVPITIDILVQLTLAGLFGLVAVTGSL